MDLEQARKLSGISLSSWRLRLRELCWAHTDFLIKQVEGQYVDEKKKPKADVLEIVVLVLLVINMIALGVFDPLNPHDVRSLVAQYIDLSLSILFLLEAVARYISFGLIIFTSDRWNMADLLIVLLSFVAAIVEAAGISFGNFTILRTVRVFRPLRSVTTLPAAKTLVLSIYSAIKSLEDVTVLYLLFIISFSIIGVTQFMGRLRTRCVRDAWMNFSSNVTLFQEQYQSLATSTSSSSPSTPFTTTSTTAAAATTSVSPSSFSAPFFAENYTISDFVCGANFEQAVGLIPSIGCGKDATCNPAQLTGGRILTGYTCPFGYQCLDVANPMFGFVSFDSVPQAMLTIFVGVTAEGLYRVAYQMMDAFDVTAAYYFVAIHIFGTFFIVNLSVVLVTVTFEHVSSRIRDSQPQLVSKMQKTLQSGPRIMRRNRGASRKGGKPGTVNITSFNAEGRKRTGSIPEEYAYLVSDFGNSVLGGGGGGSGNNSAASLHSLNQQEEAGGGGDPEEDDRMGSLADVAFRALQEKREKDAAEEIQRRRKEKAAKRRAAKKEKEAKESGGGGGGGEDKNKGKEEEDGGGGDGKKKKKSVGFSIPDANSAAAAAAGGRGNNNQEEEEDDDDDDYLDSDDDNEENQHLSFQERLALQQKKEEEADFWTRALNNSSAIKPVRVWIDNMLSQDFFESFLNGLIILNIAIMCTQHYGSGEFLNNFLEISNIVFACLFGLEWLIKLLHYGPKRYYSVPINVFDFVILVLAIVDVSIRGLFPSVTALRAIRLLKIMKSFPGILRWTVVILVSIKSSFLLLCTIFVVNYVFSTFGLHMFGGLFCNLATEGDFRPDNTLSWCPNRPRMNFDDVATAMLTTFTLMTGDNWDIVMYNAMRARSWVVAFAFVGYIILMTFVLVNILVGILLSGPSPDEVDLIGEKLFGVSIAEKQREQEDEIRRKAQELGSLEEWEENVRSAQSGKKVGKLDLMAFAERTMSAVPQKFIDSLEAVEDTILLSEHVSSVSSKRRSFQRWLKEAMSSRLIENMMLLLLSVSSIALAFETPESAPDDPGSIILRILDIVFSVLFIIELGLNFYAFGLIKGPDSYLRRDPWNVLDAFLVFTNALGTSAYFFFQARWLKILLVVRAVRPLRFVKRSQGLRTVFTAFAMSAVPLKNIIVLALIIWTMWGLMGVELFLGAFYTCSNSTLTTKFECLAPMNISSTASFPNGSSFTSFAMHPSPYAWTNADLHFDHLGASFLSLLTLSTLDGGVDIMINGIDSVGVDRAPEVNHRQRVSFYFVSFVFIGGYFLINLVVSVIIDTYNKEKSKSGDSGIFLTTSQNAFLRSHRRLLHGVPTVFYDEYDAGIWKKRARSVVSSKLFRDIATITSLLNASLLLVDYYDAPTALRTIILIANFVFALIFTIEVSTKIFALGWQRFSNSRFNLFDLLVTCFVFVGVIGEVGFPNRGFTFIFRAMRSISLFRVVRTAEKLRHVISRFSYSLYGLANVGALLFIFLYIFGVGGVKSFGLIKYHGSITRQTNFDNVFRAILLLLNALAGGGWASNMNDCALEEPFCDPQINNCGVPYWAQTYFVLFIIFTKFVLLNMFIAVILDSFVSTDFEALSISKDHVKEFFEKWMNLDPTMTLRIETQQLVPFLRSLTPENPLGFGGSELTRKIGHEFRFIQQLRLHEMDNAIELQDLITALCDATLGVALPDSEVRSLQKYADRKFHRKERDMYIGKRSQEKNQRVIERFAVHVIEQHWLEFRYRTGKRRGRVGVQSLLRSRAGEHDAASRRDNLSYVDQDASSMWGDGAGRRDDLGEYDSDEELMLDAEEVMNFSGDSRSIGSGSVSSRRRAGSNSPAAAAAAGRHSHRHRGETGGKDQQQPTVIPIFEQRPQLKNWMKQLAEPLVQAHERKQVEKVLAEAHVKGVSSKKVEQKEESHELHRLLIPKEQNEWHDEMQGRLASTIEKKEPLGGRRLHARRVLEDHFHQQKVHDLQEAEDAFALASSTSASSAAVSARNNFISSASTNSATAASASSPTASSSSSSSSSVHHQSFPWSQMESDQRKKGLIPQTSLWQERLQNEQSRKDQHQHLNKPFVSGQEDHDDLIDLHSPVSEAFRHRHNPTSKIPGTYSSAAFSSGSPTSRYASSPSATATKSFHSQGADDDIELHPIVKAASEPQRSLYHHNYHPTPPLLQQQQAEQLDSPVSPLKKKKGNPTNQLDELEVKMLMQDVKDWKGDHVPDEKRVTRPQGYNSVFSADEYSSL